MRKRNFLCQILCSLIVASGNANAVNKLTVASGQTYDNADTGSTLIFGFGENILVSGTLNNEGHINSDSTTNVRPGGIINNYGDFAAHWLWTTGGVFNNKPTGIVNIYESMHIYYGSMENFGIINFSHRFGLTQSDIYFYSNTELNNHGEIRIDTPISCNGWSGKIGNWGTFKITSNGSLHPYDWCAPFYQYEGQTVINGEFSTTEINIIGGTLSGNGTVFGLLNIGNKAAISPGDGLGTLTVDGDLNFSNSSLLIEIGGNSSGLSDRLNINGNTTVSGTLNVILTNGFIPKAGDSFDIVTATTVSGQFDTVNLPSLPNGLTWEAQTLSDRIRLNVI